MAYTAPYVDATGLHIPTYNDIREDMVNNAKSIFGEDIYLENDSADYQLISVFALKMYDTLQAIQLAYDARSPITAIGTTLDAVVKLNGIARKAAGYSTCEVKLTGTPNTQILNGVIKDQVGTLWSLPDMVIIPASGTVTTTATCQVAGASTIPINSLTEIVTPTYGWISVTNEVEAVPGRLEETDAELRQRQSLSVAMPSQTMLNGTLASIAACENVNRCAVYENDTNSASVTTQNPHGLPAHSITCVVEGGDGNEIASAILAHKGIGCYTNGDTVVEILGKNGYVNYIRFMRPNYVDVHVRVTLTHYTGFITSSNDEVKQAILDYLQAQDIGSDISLSSLIAAAMNANTDLKAPTFGISSIVIGRTAGSMAAADIVTTYREIPRGIAANIEVV